jgi:hypothetical protein
MNQEQGLGGLSLIEYLFRARMWALITVVPAMCSLGYIDGSEQDLFAFVVISTLLWIPSIVTWYLIFQIVRALHGTKHAIGHVIVSILLTPVLLMGLILIPLLVRGDVVRAAS